MLQRSVYPSCRTLLIILLGLSGVLLVTLDGVKCHDIEVSNRSGDLYVLSSIDDVLLEYDNRLGKNEECWFVVKVPMNEIYLMEVVLNGEREGFEGRLYQEDPLGIVEKTQSDGELRGERFDGSVLMSGMTGAKKWYLLIKSLKSEESSMKMRFEKLESEEDRLERIPNPFRVLEVYFDTMMKLEMHRREPRFFFVLSPEYAYSVASMMIFELTMEEGDVDIYVKSGRRPDFNDFEYADTTTNNQVKLLIPDFKSKTRYFIMLYAKVATTFQWKVTVKDGQGQCANNCSGESHGKCVEGSSTCNCKEAYRGEYCEQMVKPMEDNKALEGYVDHAMWNYYKATSSSTGGFNVLVKHDLNGDCDLYLNTGRNPTRNDFVKAEISFKNDILLVIDEPMDQLWYIGVYGYSRCAYNITTWTSTKCPDDCVSPYGVCSTDTNVCICMDGYQRAKCSEPIREVQSGNEKEMFSIKRGEHSLYRYRGKSGVFSIIITEPESPGILELQVEIFDSLHRPMSKLINNRSKEINHAITFNTQQVTSDEFITLIITVQTGPFTVDDLILFGIIVWSSPLNPNIN